MSYVGSCILILEMGSLKPTVVFKWLSFKPETPVVGVETQWLGLNGRTSFWETWGRRPVG